MKLQEMYDKRASLIAQAKDINSRTDARTGTLAADDNEQFQRIMGEVNGLTESIQREEQLRNMESQGNHQSDEGVRQHSNDDGNKKSYRDVFEKIFRSGGRANLTADEHNVMAEMQKRSQVTGTPSAGGYLVPEQWGDRIIERMRFYGPMLDTNLTFGLNTSNGQTINWPTNDDTSNEGVIIAENTDDSKVDLAFGNKQLGAFKMTSRQIRVSHELLEDNIFDLESYIAKMLGLRLGRGGNKYLTTGSGSGEPEGVVTGATLGRTAVANNAITRAEILDLKHSLDIAYRENPNTRFMLNDLTLAAIAKLTFGSQDDRPLWQPSIAVGVPDTLEGVPYVVNNAMAHVGSGAGSRVMLIGDMSEYAVRIVNGIRIKFSEHIAFNADAYVWAGYLRFDGKVLQPQAFKYLRVNPT
jgi:HK97 family phage major capsid protein